MALREFPAGDGTLWRVWDLTADKLHAATRSGQHLAPYRSGWLVFETADGAHKRGLSPIPQGWETSDEADLRRWLGEAAIAGSERLSPPGGIRAMEQADNEPVALEALPRARTFRFPGGRFWSVAEWNSGAGVVLRFSSGARALDLADFPPGWASLGDHELAALLAAAFPRDVTAPNVTHRRRQTDDGAD